MPKNLHKFRRKPTAQPVQFANPTVFIFLWNDGNDVILTKTQFIFVMSFEVEQRSGPFLTASVDGHKIFMIQLMALRWVVGLQREIYLRTSSDEEEVYQNGNLPNSVV